MQRILPTLILYSVFLLYCQAPGRTTHPLPSPGQVQTEKPSLGIPTQAHPSPTGFPVGLLVLEKVLQIPTEHYPKQVCIHSLRKEIYVTNLGNHETPPFSDGSLQIFSLETGALLHREEAKAAVECLVDTKNPYTLYYTDMFWDEVVQFDLKKRSVARRIPVKEDSVSNIKGHSYRFMPKIVLKDYEGKRIYTSLWLDGVSILDSEDGKFLKRIPKFCSLPRGLLYIPPVLHVLCYGIGGDREGEIVWLDPREGKVLKRISTGGSPRHIVFYKEKLALISNLNSKEIYLYDTENGSILKKTKAGAANTIVLDPFLPYLYISDRVGNQLLILDIENWKILSSIPVGRYPTGLGVSEDGNYLAITNFHDGNLDLFRIHRK